MSSKVELQGFDEFRAALRKLPEDLRSEASAIIQAQAEDAQRQIVSGYGEVTGNLKGRVQIRTDATRFGTGAIIRSAARHAHLYEFGTKVRRTAKGANRGQMPRADNAHAMIPKVIRARARMQRALIDLLKRAGFEVNA